jgi:hypothetical protein
MEAQSFIFINLLNLFIMATLKVLTHLNLADAKQSREARFRFYLYTDTNDAVVLEALLKEEEAAFRTDFGYNDDATYNLLKKHSFQEDSMLMVDQRWFAKVDLFFIPHIDKSWTDKTLTPIEKIVKTFHDKNPIIRSATASNYKKAVLSWNGGK